MDISLANIKKPIISLLNRYHVVIFTIVVIGSVATFVFLLNSIVAKSSDTTDALSASKDTTFDKKTIERIDKYKSSGSAPSPIDNSGGRTNPFEE